jgi:hypothetical protein
MTLPKRKVNSRPNRKLCTCRPHPASILVSVALDAGHYYFKIEDKTCDTTEPNWVFFHKNKITHFSTSLSVHVEAIQKELPAWLKTHTIKTK